MGILHGSITQFSSCLEGLSKHNLHWCRSVVSDDVSIYFTRNRVVRSPRGSPIFSQDKPHICWFLVLQVWVLPLSTDQDDSWYDTLQSRNQPMLVRFPICRFSSPCMVLYLNSQPKGKNSMGHNPVVITMWMILPCPVREILTNTTNSFLLSQISLCSKTSLGLGLSHISYIYIYTLYIYIYYGKINQMFQTTNQNHGLL